MQVVVRLLQQALHMLSDRFILATYMYRKSGGRLYRLALDHGMSPSLLSATISGARPVNHDERIIQIGAVLGLAPEDCFEDDEVSS